MSERACYIQRTDRGARLARVRLLAERSDEAWDAPAAPDADAAETVVRDAADWIRQRLSETRSAKRLDTLCLDTDGSVCSWVKGRDADAELIRSVVEGAGQGAASEEDESLDAHQTPGVADRLPRLPMEVSYDVLGEHDAEHRAAVLAAPDAPARLLIDRLDTLGVRVGRVVTIWHALAEAWDPGARANRNDTTGVLTAEHPPAAVVAIDPDAGRLVWAWSRSGTLLACGSIRVRRLRADDRNAPPHAEVLEHDIARLAGDWLGWSAQLGVCPARVVVVGTPAPGGMSAGEIGRALTRAWPGALTDIVGHDDAVGETLRRTLDARPINTFHPLAERPTRAHRSMYRWSAAALLAATLGVIVLTAAFFSRAAKAGKMADDLRQQRTQTLTAVDQSLIMDPFPVRTLDDMIQKVERRTLGFRYETPHPILSELETVSLVLAVPNLKLTNIELGPVGVTIKGELADIRAAEELGQSLSTIAGSQLRWRTPAFRTLGPDRIEGTYSASWPEQPRTTP